MHVPFLTMKGGKQTAATSTLPPVSSRQLCRMKAGASALSVLSVILSSREFSFIFKSVGALRI